MIFLETYDRQDICFTIQSSPQIMGYTPDIIVAVEKLRAVKDERLKIIETVQTPEEYQVLLAKSDVLLLCYDKQRYAVRSSGIAIEALVNGKNIISTEGTFPTFLAADAGLAIESVANIIDSINMIADNKKSYRSSAINRSIWMLKECSLEPFLKLISSEAKNILIPSGFNRADKDTKHASHLQWARLI